MSFGRVTRISSKWFTLAGEVALWEVWNGNAPMTPAAGTSRVTASFRHATFPLCSLEIVSRLFQSQISQDFQKYLLPQHSKTLTSASQQRKIPFIVRFTPSIC